MKDIGMFACLLAIGLPLLWLPEILVWVGGYFLIYQLFSYKDRRKRN